MNAFDLSGLLIPAEARATPFLRVLQAQTSPLFDGDYQSLQFSFVRRMANRWSGRVAYTLQESNYVGSNNAGAAANPDARRVWLDTDPRADYGRFVSDRRHVLAASGTVNVWSSLNVAAVVSAISGAPINELVGRDVNGDNDTNDRPIRGRDDTAFPIRSEVDSQGRAVINGLEGPGSFLIDMSFRYQIPLGGGSRASTCSTTSSMCSIEKTSFHRLAIGRRRCSWFRPPLSSRGRCSSAFACVSRPGFPVGGGADSSATAALVSLERRRTCAQWRSASLSAYAWQARRWQGRKEETAASAAP